MRLFPKLFLWFLAAHLVSVSVTVAVIFPLWSDLEPHYSARQQGAQALEVYQNEGQRAFRRWLRHQHESGIGRGMLYDSRGQPALLPKRGANRPRRPPLWQPALAGLLAGQDEVTLADGSKVVAATVLDSDGNRWRWVARPLSRVRLPWPVLLLRTTVALLVLLVAAWWLARRLSLPIASLQISSRELAAGNLRSRAPDSVTTGRDEVAALGRDFNHMAGQLEGSIQSHRQLLSDVSHELRSPLGRLQLAVELARDASAEKSAELLNRIANEGDRLEAMIADVLTVSRLDNGADKAPLPLEPMLATLLADARFEASNRGIVINASSLPAIQLTANAELLRRALENIVRNAIKYSPDGGVIEFAAGHRGGHLNITVSDNGPGVPEQDLSRLFEPFFRSSSARDRQTGGYGLGLAIAERAAKAHGGHIAADNLSGGGLRITLSLPIAGH